MEKKRNTLIKTACLVKFFSPSANIKADLSSAPHKDSETV